MKKTITAFMLCFVSIIAFGQDVAILNDENLDDYRKIQTDYKPMAKKGLVELPFSLSYYSPTGSNVAYYTLIFKITLGSTRQSLPKGSKMFLKLDNDSVITLETINEIEQYENDHEYIDALKCMYYYMYPIYSATPEQIRQMMEHKVVKMRRQVTWGEGYYDIPGGVFKDKHMCFTENLIKMKLSIDNRLNKAANQDDLLNGF